MDYRPPLFACDAMLRGLARWLRAWGYDASWTYGIDDRDLLDHAREDGRIVLTADAGILDRRAVRDEDPRTLKVSNTTPPIEQLRALIRQLGLERRPSRCMRCGGGLCKVDKASVANEAPPRTYAWLEDFFRCGRCAGLFWKGTHFERIDHRLGLLETSLEAAS